MNKELSTRINSTVGRLSGSGSASSSEMSSESDSEIPNTQKGAVRVGDGYQAVIPDYCIQKPAPVHYPEKAINVWTPNEGIGEDKIREYLKIAKDKYSYNPEQALGVLYYHEYNHECAMSDMANYVPYPDEWTNEDKALFEQAFTFYNKNFNRIQNLLPDKKLSSLIKYYYTKWKITKCAKDPSFIQKQINRKPSQNKDDSNDSVGNGADSETEFEVNGSTSGVKQECAFCQTRNRSTSYYNTSQGLLCHSCYIENNKANANGNNDDGTSDDESKSVLPNGMTKKLLDKEVLVEIAREREANICRKGVEMLELQITEKIRKIREHKQQQASIRESLVELPDMPALNQNNNRSSTRWNDSEIMLFTKAFAEFGHDFKTIAEIIGSKSETQIRQYCVDKGLIENDMEEEREVEEFSEEPRQVVGRSGK